MVKYYDKPKNLSRGKYSLKNSIFKKKQALFQRAYNPLC